MKRTFLVLFLSVLTLSQLFAIDKVLMGDTLTALSNDLAKVGRVRVSRVLQRGNNIEVYASDALASLPLTQAAVDSMRLLMSRMVLGNDNGRVLIFSNGRELSELIHGASGARFTHKPVTPLVTNLSAPYSLTKGLEGRHIAMYGSHGIYYNQKLDLWKWQRAKLLTTVEDVHTTGYTMPFLVPMLENAGAIVIQPRERDTHTQERVIDELDGDIPSQWTLVDSGGFGLKTTLLEKENPFTMGGYAVVANPAKATGENAVNAVIYHANMPIEDDYAVYVSYKTLPHSTRQALYTVVHQGVATRISINQQMGSGTWIYVGTFRFGFNPENNYIAVSAASGDGLTVTTDAVKIGGGMGSVARYPSPVTADNVRSSDNAAIKAMLNSTDDQLSLQDSITADSIARLSAYTSGYPRWLEGSRYWLQYAGIPDSVYNFTHSKNDYTDDYASRGRWANYLAGGSEVYPDGPGLNIPIDLFLAFHSDAGVRQADTIIGTLVIYTDFDDEQKTEYETGVSRLAARDYADLMQTQIVSDMQALYAPEWQRRQLMNSSYAEARNPKMPAVLLELLSHQNFADMRYSLDPRVKFTISRAIYKSMLKFVSEQYQRDYVVQPLPVENFAVGYKEGKLRLSWDSQTDPLEPTANPTFFVLYTRLNGGEWDNGQLVKGNSFSFSPELGMSYDFQVKAGNQGGLSMPSEVLSACIFNPQDKPILIVNGFTRLSAPDSYADSLHAGFLPQSYGVPYKQDVSYIGAQYEFQRDLPWLSDDNVGAGGCYGDMATEVMAGNLFDYPSKHGQVLQQMNISYVSTGIGALIHHHFIDLNDYPLVDLILGKQRLTTLGTVKLTVDYKTFPLELQELLRQYLDNGNRLLVSGAYIGGDMSTNPDDRLFLNQVLHVKLATKCATQNGLIRMRAPISSNANFMQLQVTPHPNITVSENPDGLDPYGPGAKSIGRFFDTQVSAGALWQNPDNEKNKTVVFAFPLESLLEFDELYQGAIYFLLQ